MLVVAIMLVGGIGLFYLSRGMSKYSIHQAVVNYINARAEHAKIPPHVHDYKLIGESDIYNETSIKYGLTSRTELTYMCSCGEVKKVNV
jgi:hypothetical protein